MIAVVALPADSARGVRLTEALLNEKLAPRLFATSPNDPAWTQQAEDVRDAEAVVMCWSATAIDAGAAGYRALAAACVKRGQAVFVMLDGTALPPEMAHASQYPLKPWQFGPRNIMLRLAVGDRFLRDIVIAAQNKSAGLDPPPASAITLFYRRCAVAGVTTLAAVIITGGGLKQAYDYVADMFPDVEEEAAWAAIPAATSKTCDSLQSFVDKYPGSKHAPQAQAALANPATIATWVRQPRPLDVPDALLAPKASDEKAARRLADAALKTRSANACADLAAASGAKPIRHKITMATTQCERIGKDWQCRTEAKASCIQDEPHATPLCTKRQLK